MSRRNYSQPAGSTPYQRRYAGFRGVDFTSNPMNVDFTRSPYAENIIVDSAGVVHKRPRYTLLHENLGLAEKDMHGMFMFKLPPALDSESILVTHEGKTLYFGWGAGLPTIPGMADAESQMFQHGGRLYVLDGKNYRVFYYDDSTQNPGWKDKYVYEVATPTETQIAGYYRAEEETSVDENQNQQTTISYEWQFGEKGERNLLTGRRINTFCGDDEHTTFYLDCQHFKVYKVEMYRYVPDQGGTSTSNTVTIRTGSNIRKKPSMSGDIIANTGSNTPTCVTTGKTGNWHQILWENQTAYVHQDRVSSSSGTAATIATDDKGWEIIPSATDDPDAYYKWTTSEDADKHCTKIVFAHKPPVHPMGNGLPNIRVTGAMTEVAEITHKYTSDDIQYGDTTIGIPESSMMTELISVSLNGSTLSSSAYTFTASGDHGGTIALTSTPSVDDVIAVFYRRETFRDIGLIGKCNKYGQYGEYNYDRYFFTGNADHLNRDWYTEGGDPTIVLENSYTDIGDNSTGIAGYLNFQSDMLIIKYDSNGDNLFRRTADTDGDMVIFPVRAYKGRGVTNPKAMANIKGDCVFLTPEGVYEFVSYDLGSKYGTKEMSYTIKAKLLQENLTEGVMHVWGNWLLLSFPTTGHCYVADITQQTAPSTSGGYGWEWFYWTNCPFTHSVYDTTDRTLYAAIPGYKTVWMSTWDFEGYDYADYPNGADEEPVPYTALWTTPLDAMEDPARYKFLERRGGIMHFEPFLQNLKYAMVADGNNVIMRRDEFIESDLDTERDYDFIEIHASPEVPDVCINRRLPRFKYLQFVFQNDDPETDGIGLLSLEFQYRFGRYIH